MRWDTEIPGWHWISEYEDYVIRRRVVAVSNHLTLTRFMVIPTLRFEELPEQKTLADAKSTAERHQAYVSDCRNNQKGVQT